MRVLFRTEALPSIAKYLRLVLYLVAAVCLGFYLWYILGGHLEQEALKIRFERTVAPWPGDRASRAPSGGEVCARLRLPRIGLDVVVLNGVEESILRRAAGHIPGTAAPGAPGNMGIAAHRDTFFQSLRDVRKGDLIQLTTGRGQESYRVVWMAVVKPSFVEALKPTPKRSLTLVTCFPFDYVGHAPERFIVRAEHVSGQDGTAVNRLVRFQLAGSSVNRAR